MVNDVVNSIHKKGITVGPDKLPTEVFVYGTTRLFIYLKLLFSACIRHSYLPSSFTDSEFILLVKNKISDVYDYRDIAESNSISKIFKSNL